MAVLASAEDVARVFSGDDFAGGVAVRCPNCGFNYTHIERAGTVHGDDPHEATVYPGTLVVGHTGARRSGVEIVFSCEGCPRWFSVLVQQHKGVNSVTVGTDAPKSV